MKLFFAFLVLCFMGGLVFRPARSQLAARLYLAVLCLGLAAAYVVLHKL